MGCHFLHQSTFLTNPGIEPTSPASPALAGRFFTTVLPGKLGLSSSVQSLSCVQLFVTPWTTAPPCLSPTLSITQSLFKLTSIQSVMPSNHLILCYPLLLLPLVFPSIRVFSDESVLRIRRSKFCSFSFSISLSNEYSGLISFRMDWFDLLAVQGTLKSLLQHHSSKACGMSMVMIIKMGLAYKLNSHLLHKCLF